MTTEPKFVPNEAIEITIDNNLKLKKIYNKDTDAKVMKFELEASGYTCS